MSSFSFRQFMLLAILLLISGAGADGFGYWKNFFKEQVKTILDKNSDKVDAFVNDLSTNLNKQFGEGSDKAVLGFIENVLDGGSPQESKGVAVIREESPVTNEIQVQVKNDVVEPFSEESEERLSSQIGTITITTPVNEASSEGSRKGSSKLPEPVNGNNEKAEENGGVSFEKIGATLHNVTSNHAAAVINFTTQLTQNFTGNLDKFGLTLSNTVNNTASVVNELKKYFAENFTMNLEEEIEAVKTDLIKTGTENLEEGMKTVGAIVDLLKLFINEDTEEEEASSQSEADTDGATSLLTPAVFIDTLKTVFSNVEKAFNESGKNLELKIESATNHLNKTLNENFGDGLASILPVSDKISNHWGTLLTGFSKMEKGNGSILDTFEMVSLIGNAFMESSSTEDIEDEDIEEEDELIVDNNKAKLTQNAEPETNPTWLITEILIGTGAAIIVVIGAGILFFVWNRRRVNNKCHVLKV